MHSAPFGCVQTVRHEGTVYDRLHADAKAHEDKVRAKHEELGIEFRARPTSAGARLGGEARPLSAKGRPGSAKGVAGGCAAGSKYELVDVPEDRSPSPPGRLY